MSIKALEYEQAKGILHLVEAILNGRVRAYFALMGALPKGYGLAVMEEEE